jgi:predicted MFS family arabinose efflux permease
MSSNTYEKTLRESEPFLEGSPPSRPHFHKAASPLTWWAAGSFAAILGFSRLSYGLLMPALHIDLAASYSVLGLVQTFNYVGYLLGTLALPLLLARIHNRILLNVVAVLAMGITMFASALSFTLWQLALWRFLIGFFSAVATVLTITLTLECIYPRERGQASGIAWIGGMIGIVISGLIAPPILAAGSTSGWRLVWIVMAAIGIISAIGFYLTRRRIMPAVIDRQTGQSREQSAAGQSWWQSIRQLFQPRQLLFLTLVYALFGAGYIIYLTFVIPLLEQQGVSALNEGFIWAAIGAAGALSGWFWGKAIDRWSTGYTVAISLGFGAIGALSALVGNPGLEYAGAALFGLAGTVGPTLMITTLLKRAVTDEQYAVNFSMITALFAAGQIIGPLAGSIIVAHRGLGMGLALAPVILGLAALSAYGYGIMQTKRG